MDPAKNKILTKMLERLFNSLMNGPSLNCRPHASRQRIDWMQLGKLGDLAPDECLMTLLSEKRRVSVSARVPAPVRASAAEPTETSGNGRERTPEERAWDEQRAVVSKLRSITEDARTYEQDTGVHVLNLGYPLLSLPPGTLGSRQRAATRRIVAPIAFIPVTVTLKTGVISSVEIACRGDGIDLVVPNTALMAWLEQQSGKPAAELFADESGEDPWREIAELTRHVSNLLGLAPPVSVGPRTEDGASAPPALQPSPRTDEADAAASIIPAAVLGLFPLTNQGLLRDMQALTAGEPVSGPIESFLRVDATLESHFDANAETSPKAPQKTRRSFAQERLISAADPCQIRAVKLARSTSGLVVHGPPGTGKSQTITNMIGDHLARGERVLVVCDKRTALDVVMSRLEAIGLGRLCAVVHDPQRDQRDLYKSIREQLDGLADATTDARAGKQVERIDANLQRLHDELSNYHEALSTRSSDDGHSLHDLVGEWFSIATDTSGDLEEQRLSEIGVQDVEEQSHEIHNVLERGHAAEYAHNPWVHAAGISLRDYLAMPMDRVRQSADACEKAAVAVDETGDEAIPPLSADSPLPEQAAFRRDLAERLRSVLASVSPPFRAHWASRDAAAVAAARRKLAESKAIIDTFQAQPMDAELALVVRDSPLQITRINADLAALTAYLAIADKWYAFLKPGVKKTATAVATPYGLTLDKAAAQRLRGFLAGLRARLILTDLHQTVLAVPSCAKLLNDDELSSSLKQHGELLELLAFVNDSEHGRPLAPLVSQALVEAAAGERLLRGLQKSPARCDAIETVCKTITASRLFSPDWLGELRRSLCDGGAASPALVTLVQALPTLENILRVREGLQRLPSGVAKALEHLVGAGIDTERGLPILRKAALANAITQRLADDPQLHGIDGQRIKTSFDRYRQLEFEKIGAVRDHILHRWVSLQKERLLAATGSRMNSLGAEVRRRLMLRGQKALRLRQAIALGESIEGGDPLFDLRPVWLASPETVAQLFPRQAVFDVVVFDEASQCRLEEALPVLTRGRRVVIAGDVKQLPPTRFFESAVTVSEDEAVETGQELFEVQQSDVEDLLSAALNLDIQESYLDVHYRSRNADLIGFSNQQFYDSRLQPIPGHPANRIRYSPITLYQVNGLYEERGNKTEADAVCRIVRDLLRRAEPPSIGIACFNITQRDLIIERLDALAEEDREFARRLDDARRRTGHGASAYLFVRNLENVQGDERDHMIVSTTYGPDAKGRFYQRFGPLGRVGGGRRLNVLVTRAREELHLVTSIPTSVYRSAPPVPPGQTPGGGWLLYAYLRYAELLAGLYEKAHAQAAEADAGNAAAVVDAGRTTSPSPLTEAIAAHLARRHRTGSTTYWGNDGFCVDLALHHPKFAEDVTIGVMCDASRYAKSDDPVEWDVFRTAILESQGWTLHRIWSPHFFRDAAGHIDRILRAVDSFVTSEKPRDSLPIA